MRAVADAIDYKEFGDRLRLEIKKRGWTQPQFAQEIALASGGPPPSGPTVSKWLTGKAFPRLYIQTISAVLGLSSDELVKPSLVSAQPLDARAKDILQAARERGYEDAQVAKIELILREPAGHYGTKQLDLPASAVKDSGVQPKRKVAQRKRRRAI
jgi:transcriptional regulator with XRE-family HTH domain